MAQVTFWYRDTIGQVDFQRWWQLHARSMTVERNGDFMTFSYVPLPDEQRDFTDGLAGEPSYWTEAQKFRK